MIRILEKRIGFEEIRNDADVVIKNALAEDVGEGDITSRTLVPETTTGEFHLISKDNGTLAGIQIFTRVFELFDPAIQVTLHAEDGKAIKYTERIATLTGPVRSILTAERVALNLLQHLSGIAGKTQEAVKAIEGYPSKILDTRKTLPGLRMLQKYAVAVGGGYNHRYRLDEMFLIKENHIEAAGGIREAIKLARRNNPEKKLVEVEVKTDKELTDAFDMLPDIIMLDNMNDIAIKRAKDLVGRRCRIEVSGKVNIGRLLTLARMEVDYISMGILTHSVLAHDFSLLMKGATH